jgi:hypothetical protein
MTARTSKSDGARNLTHTGRPPAKGDDLEALFGLLRAPRERAAALPMAAEERMHARPGARPRPPCGRCAVVVLQMKAASE